MRLHGDIGNDRCRESTDDNSRVARRRVAEEDSPSACRYAATKRPVWAKPSPSAI